MGKFLGGLVVGLILVPTLGAIFFFGGFAPAAVSDPQFPYERIIAGGALEARVRKEAPKRDPSSFRAADIVAGAQTYGRTCGGCHGLPPQVLRQNLPGQPPNMFPPPPQLFTPDGYVTDDPIGATYWKIENGIRLTGMPSFKTTLTDDQAWQIAALLGSADKLSPEALDALKPSPPPGGLNAKQAPDQERATK